MQPGPPVAPRGDSWGFPNQCTVGSQPREVAASSDGEHSGGHSPTAHIWATGLTVEHCFDGAGIWPYQNQELEVRSMNEVVEM